MTRDEVRELMQATGYIMNRFNVTEDVALHVANEVLRPSHKRAKAWFFLMLFLLVIILQDIALAWMRPDPVYVIEHGACVLLEDPADYIGQ